MHKDGKYGWLIVASSFVICFLCDGIRYSYGILFIEFLNEFEESKSTTSWIGSIMFGVMNFLGPITSVLVNRFGCRTVTIAGSVISALGFVTSFFGRNVFHLCVTMGALGGTGFSMLMLPLNVMITDYFERKRSRAMGISVCGSGLGGIVFAPIAKWLIDMYSWRGATLIEGALLLNCVPCGLVMRPFYSAVQTKEGHELMDMNTRLQREECNGKMFKNKLTSDVLEDSSNTGETKLKLMQEEEELEEQLMQCSSAICKDRHNIDVTNGSTNSATEHQISLAKQPSEFSHTCLMDVQSYFKIGLLKEYAFILFLISCLFEGLAFDAIFSFLPDMVVRRGHERIKATLLLSAVGIASTVSRIPTGFIADLKCTNKLYYLIIVFLVYGLCVIALPFCEVFTTMLCFCAGLGLMLGSNAVLVPLVLADLFGDDRMSDSKGFISFIYGIAIIAGLPIAGAIFDATGNYTLTFISLGLEFLFAGGFLWLIVCSKCSFKDPEEKRKTAK